MVHFELAINSTPWEGLGSCCPSREAFPVSPQPVLHPPAVQCASPTLVTWPLCWPQSAICQNTRRQSIALVISPFINTQWHNQGVGSVMISATFRSGSVPHRQNGGGNWEEENDCQREICPSESWTSCPPTILAQLSGSRSMLDMDLIDVYWKQLSLSHLFESRLISFGQPQIQTMASTWWAQSPLAMANHCQC